MGPTQATWLFACVFTSYLTLDMIQSYVQMDVEDRERDDPAGQYSC